MDILVVDDDDLDQQLFQRALKKSLDAIKVCFAASVGEARNMINTMNFDVILLDQHLPDVDGISFLNELKLNQSANKCTVVMVSNSTDENLALECLKAGAQDFVLKSSINPTMLKTVIANAKTRKELEAKLLASHERTRILAERDTLTGLCNRFFFEQTVTNALASRRQKKLVSLMFIDLDNFKKINDTWGHKHGDALLTRVARRISSCLRGSELFARFGGDEFVIFLQEVHSANEITRIANRILQVLPAPFEFDGFTFYTSASIGISTQASENIDADTLITQADIAMHRAKQDGKNQVCFFEADMQAEFSRRVMIENGLRKALTHEEFVLHFQPIVAISNRQIRGYEALVRWQREGVLTPPNDFIPIAQESNLIMDIGHWVIREAIRQLSVLDADHYVTVNLSPLQLRDPELPSFIIAQAASYNLSPERLVLELTETAFTDQRADVYQAVSDLRKAGFNVALDDFGTGFSSLSHLRDLPISTVKIDRSMLPEKKNPRQEKLLKGLVQMIQALELDIVIEGVETEAQHQLCRSLNISNGQGYLYGKPAPFAHH
ncbi:two-component system response regulator [Simiduia agarivorans]|uniref:Response regulator/GGDEF domain-containing protein n=1 Tax=Simiduia agarivorans (strain DSM 21679 / JCM 13881 / BCRC 17597 / SA1) TaxID=1117647 RepID=K4KMN1_SIMAS|nr:GGDEF domain-containing response regulator [Simiduia agarivorans]AFV00272.1 response regulator/GGDEF domain-containing protein [Simiduia agarivorans SA1 = DSM 21679]